MADKVAVVLFNLGGPDGPDAVQSLPEEPSSAIRRSFARQRPCAFSCRA